MEHHVSISNGTEVPLNGSKLYHALVSKPGHIRRADDIHKQYYKSTGSRRSSLDSCNSSGCIREVLCGSRSEGGCIELVSPDTTGLLMESDNALRLTSTATEFGDQLVVSADSSCFNEHNSDSNSSLSQGQAGQHKPNITLCKSLSEPLYKRALQEAASNGGTTRYWKCEGINPPLVYKLGSQVTVSESHYFSESDVSQSRDGYSQSSSSVEWKDVPVVSTTGVIRSSTGSEPSFCSYRLCEASPMDSKPDDEYPSESRPPLLRRSVSEETSNACSSGSYRRLSSHEVVVSECAPLDLSMTTKVINISSGVCMNAGSKPKLSLMELADVATFMLENDQEAAITSVNSSSSRSSPSILSDSNSSNSTCFDEKADLISYQCFDRYNDQVVAYMDDRSQDDTDDCSHISIGDCSPSYKNVKYESSETDDCSSVAMEDLSQEYKNIKYEMSENFNPEGIILDSNVPTDKVCQDTIWNGPIVVAADDDRVLTADVANLTFEDGPLETPYFIPVYSDYVVPGSTLSVATPYHTGPLHLQDMDSQHCRSSRSASSGSECSVITRKSSQIPVSDGYLTSSSASGNMSSSESRRRLRLAKAEYESMSEEDRRTRHRVLDNQRSKQYRERRRRMYNGLQQQMTGLEDKNKYLRDSLSNLERLTSVMRRAVDYTERSCNRVVQHPHSYIIKTEC